MPLLDFLSLLQSQFLGRDLLRRELHQPQLVVEDVLTVSVFVVDDHSQLVEVVLDALLKVVLQGVHLGVLLKPHVLGSLDHFVRLLWRLSLGFSSLPV